MHCLHDVVSPELALVDPELALRLREVLPVREDSRDSPDAAPRGGEVGGCAVAAPIVSSADAAVQAALRRITESQLETPKDGHRRRRSLRVVVVGSCLVVIAVGGALALDHASSSGGDGIPSALATSSRSAVPIGDRPAQSDGESPSNTALRPPDPRSPTSASQAVPGEAKPMRTGSGSSLPVPIPISSSRQVAWAPVTGATRYRVEVVRAGSKIYATLTARPDVRIPHSWKRAGTSYRRHPEDQLFVWAVVDGRQAREPLVDGVLLFDADFH